MYENMPAIYSACFDVVDAAAASMGPVQLRSTSSFRVLGETPLQGALPKPYI